MTVHVRPERHPVRVSLAFSGGGSLGTWLSGAARELIRSIREHNQALLDEAVDSDPRFLRPNWGRITVDSLGGASAGALVSAQVVRALFEPEYLGDGSSVDARATITGDWVNGADFKALSVTGNAPSKSGPVSAPGWTLLSGATLYDLCVRALGSDRSRAPDAASPLDENGVVGVGITLTDLLGFHEPAEFDADRVLGHPEFGCASATTPNRMADRSRPVRDLGGKGHAEVRKLFVARDASAADVARTFLLRTRRRSRARVARWGESAGERLAALCTASAALPLAVGPVAVDEYASSAQHRYRRLYMDGGVMNNKPLAPALRLARWHDQARLLTVWDGLSHEFDPELVEQTLCYERVVIFVDAFPDRTIDNWRSAHPDRLFSETGSYQVVNAANDAREARIQDALGTPTGGMNVFFESIMTSLRAQDMRVIAKTNSQLQARDLMIDNLCLDVPRMAGELRLNSVEMATAYAAVRSRPRGRGLPIGDALAVASIVAGSDVVSGLGGRRAVTVVPIWAPENLRAAYAGDAFYSIGGLLSQDARRHDAELGVAVARRVIEAVRDPDSVSAEHRLHDAPEASLPRDAGPLATRLVVALRAMLDGLLWRSPVLRFFAKLPLRLSPILARFKRWLDVRVPGNPVLRIPRKPRISADE